MQQSTTTNTGNNFVILKFGVLCLQRYKLNEVGKFFHLPMLLSLKLMKTLSLLRYTTSSETFEVGL